MRFLLIALLLIGCADPVEEVATEEVGSSATAEDVNMIDLGSEGLPFSVVIPKAMGDAEVFWNEEFGYVEVRAGDRFGLTISEYPADIERKKADLHRDLLQTHEILSDDDQGLIYRSSFPDNDKLVFHHMYIVLEHEGRTFIVEDRAAGQFNLKDIELMANSLQLVEAI